MKRILRSMLALGALALSGCGDSTGPVPELGEPELVSFLYACRTWTPQIDPSTVVLADLELHPEGIAPAESFVRSRGGRVVHRYHVDMLRVVIRAGDLPLLQRLGIARGVTDPEKIDASVLVAYSRAPTEADVQALRARGGRDFTVIAMSRVIAATVSDAAIPLIKQDPGVIYVESNAAFCVG